MKKFVILFFFIFLVSFISAACSEGQIDINSASLSELDEIKWVGIPTAEKIIASRPFNSLDDLMRVSGLGGTGARVEDIKEQGLACVREKDVEIPITSEIQENEVDIVDASGDKDEENYKEEVEDKVMKLNEKIQEDSTKEEKELETIELNSITSQTIKSEDYMESLSGKNYAKYGLILFCFFLLGLFATKKYKVRKNEFR